MFKTKQITLMLATALLFLGACGNNEDLLPDVDNPQQQQQVPLPIITAQIGGDDTNTRAGVVENNTDYAKGGERFYWTNGDQVRIKFYQGGTESKTLIYSAASIETDKPNLCSFTTTGTITAGTYNLLGLYPESLSVSSTSPTSIGLLTQSGNNSSAHLSGQLLMKGKVFNAALTAASTTQSMRFNHLTSVVRYVLTNNTGNANLKVVSITLKCSTAHFVSKAYLAGIDAQTLTPAAANANTAKLTVTDGTFDTNNNTFHGFTRVVTGGDAIEDLTVSIALSDNGQTTTLSTTIPASSLASVLGQGFKPGHSYYFHLNINSAGLEVSSISEWEGVNDEATEGEVNYETAYVVGDYYPDPADPTTAIGVVFWVDPKDNRHGKIVSADEGSGLAWCSRSTAYSITDATSWYDGMENMNTVYTIDPGYGTYYPAFSWVHAKNGGGLTNYYIGATTGVWYLPALEEMRMLTAGYCGVAYEDVADGWGLYEEIPDWDSSAYSYARGDFDNKLLVITGGSGLRTTTSYWTSTEVGLSDAFMNKWKYGFDYTLKSGSYGVRAIYSF